MTKEAALKLKEGARHFGVELSAEQVRQFEVYLEQLREWNKKINLTSVTKELDIVTHHFLDSLSCVKSGRIRPSVRLVDIGAGAGFPGIPLKLVVPSISATLVDSSRKKAVFLESLVKELGLENIDVVNQRVEEFGKESSNRESYDIVVARALSSLPVLVEYSLPLLKLNGALIAQMGKKDDAQLKRGSEAASILGGAIEEVLRVDVPFLEKERHLVIIGKNSQLLRVFPADPGLRAKDHWEEPTTLL